MNMDYQEFLKRKKVVVQACGFDCEERNPALFDWQNDVVRWALRKGKCAIFTACGTGKSRVQLQWAQKVHEHTGKPMLILAPLAVTQQTKREGEACGITVNVVRNQEQCVNGLNITNYEMLQHFDARKFVGIVLDESSIIKHKEGKFRQMIQLLPQSYIQKRTVMMSYAALRNIYQQRAGHKLNEWNDFRMWVGSLPESWMITE